MLIPGVEYPIDFIGADQAGNRLYSIIAENKGYQITYYPNHTPPYIKISSECSQRLFNILLGRFEALHKGEIDEYDLAFVIREY